MFFRHKIEVACLLSLLCVFSADSFAKDPQVTVPLTPTAEPEDHLRELRSQMDQLDRQMAMLKDEKKALVNQARTTQHEQFNVRQQMLESDKELRAMRQQIETKQIELHDLQIALAARMAENPEYAAFRSQKTAGIESSEAIQKKIRELASDRVRTQLEIQSLEKQQTEKATDATSVSGEAGPASLAEDPDQL